MTSATADSFVLKTHSKNNRTSDIRRKPESTMQLARLQRIGNLTDWKSTHADIQLQPSSCIESYLDLVTVSYTHLTLPTKA